VSWGNVLGVELHHIHNATVWSNSEFAFAKLYSLHLCLCKTVWVEIVTHVFLKKLVGLNENIAIRNYYKL